MAKSPKFLGGWFWYRCHYPFPAARPITFRRFTSWNRDGGAIAQVYYEVWFLIFMCFEIASRSYAWTRRSFHLLGRASPVEQHWLTKLIAILAMILFLILVILGCFPVVGEFAMRETLLGGVSHFHVSYH